MTTTLLRGALALLGDELSFDRQPRDVLIQHGRIAAIEPAGSITQADEVIELPKRLLAPGLVNGHQHSHEHFQRGRTENLPLELWMHLVRTRIPVKLTARQVYLRTMIGAIESLRTGCTTLVDDLAFGPAIAREQIDAALQAYDDAGIRALVGFAMMDTPIVDNFPFVDELVPPALLAELRAVPRPSPDAQVALVRELAASRHPQQQRVGVLVSASAPQRCTEAYLRRLRALADELALPVITHVQETRLQVVTGQLFHGCTLIEHLQRIGFLKPATSLIHAVWLNPREIAALAESGATAQHNPWSNLLLGSGVQPVRELLDAGVNLSLGSDGSCSTVTTSMLQTVGSAAGLSKLRGDDPARWLSAREAWQAGTLAGGRALGFGDTLGSLRVGARADLVGYRLDSVSFTPLNDPLRQLAYAERGAGVDFAMVDGELALRGGRLTRIDEAALLAEIETEFHGLAERYREAEASTAPVLAAMEAIYRRSLTLPVAADTYPGAADRMKLLLINPNTTQAVTDAVLLAARAAARPGTELKAVTGSFGPVVIGSRAENALAAHGVLQLAAEHAGRSDACDAVVLAVSLDTGLWACRELLGVPVIGMTEAGLLMGCSVATRIGLVTYGRRMGPLYRELAEGCGMASRIAGIATLDVTPQQTFSDPQAVRAATLAAARQLVQCDGAEAVLLAGAAMAAMARELQAEIDVPLLDGVACAVALAEAHAGLKLPKARNGSVSPTGGREVKGMSPQLTALFANKP